ncbi:MAG TPA: hypothetical protein VEA41_22920, partial [Salinarimonas sp.]|nr:hypothetical protein [Salinarimonas sp.]
MASRFPVLPPRPADGLGAPARAQKKGRTEVRPKSREETPKEGSDTATPIAISHCTIYAALHKLQGQTSGMPRFFRPQGNQRIWVWPIGHTQVPGSAAFFKAGGIRLWQAATALVKGRRTRKKAPLPGTAPRDHGS